MMPLIFLQGDLGAGACLYCTKLANDSPMPIHYMSLFYILPHASILSILDGKDSIQIMIY